jgi:hypothetical protein
MTGERKEVMMYFPVHTHIESGRSLPQYAQTRPKFIPATLVLVFVCLALSPAARAVSPAPDGGYSNFNTAEGDHALENLTSGIENTALGFDALKLDTTGSFNTATGVEVLPNNTTGELNTGSGPFALNQNTTGNNNTATGVEALEFTNTGGDNTATGVFALQDNTTGNRNVATGSGALQFSTTPSDNVATGFNALHKNSTGALNTATGTNALTSNDTSDFNTATGGNSLFNNTTGTQNTATGVNALFHNTTSNFNTATGVNSLFNNTTGTQEAASGNNALFSNTTGNFNTAHGVNALYHNTTGSSNIALGNAAGFGITTGSNNIDIGNQGTPSDTNAIKIGNSVHQATFIAGISGKTVPTGVGVLIDANGHLGTMTSSARFKQNIKPMGQASEAILALEPVTFQYRQELDPAGIPQFGLVAEQVEKVDPNLVARDEQGKVYTVRYEAVNAMLLNEFLKQHRKLEEQQATITQLKSALARQDEQIRTLADTVSKSQTPAE